MTFFRRSLAAALSLALVALAPGSSAYQAAAQTMTTAAGSSASGVSGAVGSNLGNGGVTSVPAMTAGSLGLNPSLSAPSMSAPALRDAVAAFPAAALPAAALPAASFGAFAIPGAALKAAAIQPGAGVSVPAAKTPAAKTAAALQAITPAPAVSDVPAETQAAEARKTFDGEALKSDLSAPAIGEGSNGSRETGLKASKKGQGTPEEKLDENGSPKQNGALDGQGNPTRVGGEGGPDDRHEGGERAGSEVLKMFGVGMLAGGAAVAAGLSFGSIAMFPMIILSLVLHEIGHARVADKLGDPTARLQNRASFNPKHWMTHIDPIWTLLIPAITFLTTGMIFGGARPVPVETRYFKNPVKGMAIVALAGPAVNFGLAAAGALAVTGAVAAGMAPAIVGLLVSFTFLNALLAVFNMIPLPPLDGSHILKAFLPWKARVAVDGFFDKLGPMGFFLPIMILFWVAGGAISAAAMFVTKVLIGGASAVTGVKLASAFLPALAALGMAVGQLGAPAEQPKKDGAQAAATPAPANPNDAPGAASAGSAPVDLIVMFGEKTSNLHDAHITNVDVNLPNGVEQYTRLQQAMLAQLESVGLDSASLEPYKATPLATYKRINAATIRVDGASAAEFTKQMAERGFAVYPNSRRRIYPPVKTKPEDMDPEARGAVTMDENLQIVKADGVIAEGERRWGKPEMTPWQRFWASIFKAEPPQPKFGVIDSGADTSHPLLKRVKEVKNMTSGENVDDIGHGSWVTSTVLHFAKWSKNTTHYKTFLNGSATTDDILKALTQAGNDGNLVISNSWGDDEGDPKGPDAQLVRKLAEEGHIMVFAAGNAGSRANTIGSPAIITYKDPKTQAIRVVSVAATDKTKKVAYFSSRGPGSPVTSKDPNYKDHRPDLAAVGHNIEGAWPQALGDADRTDGDKGTVKAISGTSMSTPGVAGAIALLCMMFGVTEKGDRLDAVVNAVMATLEKTGKNDRDAEGEGFLNVDAAYKALQQTLGNVPPDVSSYRAKVSRLSTLQRFISMSGSWKHGVMIDAGEFSRAVAERDQLISEVKAMESADETLAYRAAGPVKRLIMKATGAAPRN